MHVRGVRRHVKTRNRTGFSVHERRRPRHAWCQADPLYPWIHGRETPGALVSKTRSINSFNGVSFTPRTVTSDGIICIVLGEINVIHYACKYCWKSREGSVGWPTLGNGEHVAQRGTRSDGADAITEITKCMWAEERGHPRGKIPMERDTLEFGGRTALKTRC